ncbi:helix-turn-helix domain-containing protein [Variovorax sp. 22077]|uniref:helix-turn-helix domain-containing protein n=1 Tax=Variovorax sp. 22077 TaxID=3453867 RepID=UPI003F86D940
MPSGQSRFARRAGVRQTTVRHYLREGLLSPRTGPAGGSRPCLEFTESDLRLLSAIRAGQALSLSLQEAFTQAAKSAARRPTANRRSQAPHAAPSRSSGTDLQPCAPSRPQAKADC